MKKTLFFGTLLLLLFASSCQKENTSASKLAPAPGNQQLNNRGPNDITIIDGDGLGLCGVAVGDSDCDLCTGVLSRDIIITGSPAVYTLDGQGFFVLYNFGSNDVTVTVFFNCPGTAVEIKVPADTKVLCRIDIDPFGCCSAVEIPLC